MGFFDRFFGNRGSASTAKNRLRFALVHDSGALAPGQMEIIRDEIIGVLSKHLKVDRDQVNISLDQGADDVRLLVDVPLTIHKKTGRPTPSV